MNACLQFYDDRACDHNTNGPSPLSAISKGNLQSIVMS